MKTLEHLSVRDGSDVVKIRTLLGLTQSELAKELGYNRYQTISEFENGKDIPKRFKIALRSLYINRIQEKINE